MGNGGNCPLHFTSFLLCNRTPKYLSQPFLFGHEILMPQTPTIRYAVFLVRFWFHRFFYFESNRLIDSTTTTTIRQSHHRSMSGLLNRIILFFSLIITALLLIHCSSRFLRSFLYGRYSRDQQPRGHLHSSTCYITTIFSLIAFDVITVTITCCEAQVDKILQIIIVFN